MITIKQAQALSFDTLQEMWAEEYIAFHKKLPHRHIKFRHKFELLNEINTLQKLNRIGDSE